MVAVLDRDIERRATWPENGSPRDDSKASAPDVIAQNAGYAARDDDTDGEDVPVPQQEREQLHPAGHTEQAKSTVAKLAGEASVQAAKDDVGENPHRLEEQNTERRIGSKVLGSIFDSDLGAGREGEVMVVGAESTATAEKARQESGEDTTSRSTITDVRDSNADQELQYDTDNERGHIPVATEAESVKPAAAADASGNDDDGDSGHPREDKTGFEDPDEPGRRYDLPEEFALDRSAARMGGGRSHGGSLEVYRGRNDMVSAEAKVMGRSRVGWNSREGQPVYGRRVKTDVSLYGPEGALVVRREATTDYPYDAPDPEAAKRADFRETRSEALAREAATREIRSLADGLQPIALREEQAADAEEQEEVVTEAESLETVPMSELKGLLTEAERYAAERGPSARGAVALLGALVEASVGKNTVQLPSHAMSELYELSFPPEAAHVAKLDRFGLTDAHALSAKDVVLVERTLALMRPRSAQLLRLGTPDGGNLSVTEIGDRTGLGAGVQQKRSRARGEFQKLATEVDRGTVNLKEYAREYPERRSVLTLLACLEEPIGVTERLSDLRVRAMEVLERRVASGHVTPQMLPRFVALYGLTNGEPQTTQQVSETLGGHPTYLRQEERRLLGQIPPDWRHQYRSPQG